MKKYKIVISGPIIESTWLHLEEKQYKYWDDKGEEKLLEYINSTYEEDLQSIEKNEEENLFLTENEEKVLYCDASNNEMMQYGTLTEDCRVVISEIDGQSEDSFDNEGDIISTLYDMSFYDFVDLLEENNFDENVEKTYHNPKNNFYINYFKQYKGDFFVGYINAEDFSIEKIKFKVTSDFDEIDILEEVYYQDVIVDNMGGFTEFNSESVVMYNDI